jgi:hypothetical protein
MFQQYVFRFDVAVDYVQIVQERQGLQNLHRETVDQVQGEAAEFVVAQEVVQAAVEKLEDQAAVLAECEVVF